MSLIPDFFKVGVSCLHPKLVYNKYTHEEVFVPCGHCSVCLNKRSISRKNACLMEAASHRYTFFVTLTYKNNYVPFVEFYKDSFTQRINFIDCCSRSRSYNDLVGSFDSSELSFIRSLAHKQKSTSYNTRVYFKSNPDVLFYALKSDIQKYIKRVRFHVFKQTGEYIRYFAVSEYGPKSLRPHFHLLFYFDKPETLSKFRRITVKCWQYGDVVSELSEGKSDSYVSGYLNSFLCLIGSSSAGSLGTSSLPQSQPLAPYFNGIGSAFENMLSRNAQINNLNSVTDKNNAELPFLPEFYGDRNFGQKLSNQGFKLSNQGLKLSNEAQSLLNRFNLQTFNSRVKSVETQYNIQDAQLSGILLDNKTKKFLNSILPAERQADFIYKYVSINKLIEDAKLSKEHQKLARQQVSSMMKNDLQTDAETKILEKDYYKLEKTVDNVVDAINASSAATQYRSEYESDYYWPLIQPDSSAGKVARGVRYLREVFPFSSAISSFLK